MGTPWFKFYASDFLAGTSGLTAAERGVYITLLALMYEREGPVQLDRPRLARRCGVPAGSFKRILEALIDERCLYITADDALSSVRFDDDMKPSRRNLSAALRPAILERDQWTCSYCGTEDGPFHVDHIYPVSKGGSDDLDNLCCSCAPCNLKKSDKTLQELGWSCD